MAAHARWIAFHVFGATKTSSLAPIDYAEQLSVLEVSCALLRFATMRLMFY